MVTWSTWQRKDVQLFTIYKFIVLGKPRSLCWKWTEKRGHIVRTQKMNVFTPPPPPSPLAPLLHVRILYRKVELLIWNVRIDLTPSPLWCVRTKWMTPKYTTNKHISSNRLKPLIITGYMMTLGLVKVTQSIWFTIQVIPLENDAYPSVIGDLVHHPFDRRFRIIFIK